MVLKKREKPDHLNLTSHFGPVYWIRASTVGECGT